MKLSTAGRQAIWLGVGLIAAAILLGNTLILPVGVSVILSLAIYGIRFRRTLQIAGYSLKLESSPSHSFVRVGQSLKILNTIANGSDLRFIIDSVDLNLPAEIEKTSQESKIELSPHGKSDVELFLTPKVAGKYDLSRSNVVFRSKLGLFTSAVELHIKTTIVATSSPRRVTTPLRPEVLESISVDPIRRGPGTDLAGLRPFRYSDDLRSINWRATARSGKLIVNESYLERDASILLVIDIACLRLAFEELTELLAAREISTSSVGLILHDENGVIARVWPAAGVTNRQNILRLIAEEAGSKTAATPATRRVERLYRTFARERLALERVLFYGSVAPSSEKLGVLADFILPFLRSAESKHLLRLRRQAAFRAFEITSQVRERTLVIALSTGQDDLSGLFEGAVHATRVGHEVIVAILNPKSWSAAKEFVPEGITLLTCRADELVNSLGHTILRMSRRRLNATTLETAAS